VGVFSPGTSDRAAFALTKGEWPGYDRRRRSDSEAALIVIGPNHLAEAGSPFVALVCGKLVAGRDLPHSRNAQIANRKVPAATPMINRRISR